MLIEDFQNLLGAARAAKKSKKLSTTAAQFFHAFASEILKLEKELGEQTWLPGGFKVFTIYDPKERMISAAPFADRVVHHALCNIIEPVFEKTFVHESFANRKGKGSHAAIELFQKHARRFPYVLKCDLKKFFPSLDHEILKEEIRRKIRQKDLLWLCDLIIEYSNPQEAVHEYFEGDDLFTPFERKKGLPIGNLTSQFWANVYLNRFDHFVKEQLRVKGYIRYVDDFVLFAETKEQLHTWKKALESYLAQQLRMKLHPQKTQIYLCADGVPFLGFQVFPYYRYVRKEKVKRYRRFLKKKITLFKQQKLSPAKLEAAINSWLGHIRFGQSKRLEYQVYWQLRNAGIKVLKHPNGSWKVLEVDTMDMDAQ